MRQPVAQPQVDAATKLVPALNYAPRTLRLRHSLYSSLSLVMAFVSLVWLGFIHARLGGGPPHYRIWDPTWCALYDNFMWPGGIGIALAVMGLVQSSRKRTLSVVAVVIIALVYWLLMPPGNFA